MNVNVDLNIEDRPWDPNRPDTSAGWCAEASIQMAMGFFGKSVSQSQVNKAGKPEHADLYAHNIDLALRTLGVNFNAWDQDAGSLMNFIDWIKDHLSQGHPVLVGCKIYPTEHPSWDLDHFMLMVGFTKKGLIANTTLDGQLILDYSQLTSRKKGYSFANTGNTYFARALTGLIPTQASEIK